MTNPVLKPLKRAPHGSNISHFADSKTNVMTTLEQVRSRFPIVYATDPNFFPEWKQDLPALTDLELFGLVTNGEEFRFVKLEQDGPITFDLSDVLSLLPPSRNQLPIVVQILKALEQFQST
jgi:hypothetical protein